MKYNKILVPLDGSKLAQAVLPYAGFIAGALRLPIDLIHVTDPETVSPSLHRTRAADYLNQASASFLDGLTVSSTVKSGAAAEVIINAASADAGILIAMATHGQTGGRRWLLGGVAQKVLQSSTHPLLLIRPQEGETLASEARIQTIIVPLDGSRVAEQVFPHVIYLATQLSVPVVLIRTYPLPAAGYFLAAHVSPPDMAELREKTKKEVGEYLQAKIEELRSKGIQNLTSVVVEGRGPDEIIELARKTAGSMIAMSSHGRSGIGRWVLGSVTDRVVSYGGDPVLVIRSATS
ncbi:MAG TPA: universal stress protein [Candidatus Binatia bacterium]|jgi:nucleotide-binding universal stress UspA family protein